MVFVNINLGVTGIYTLAAPFNTLLKQNVAYTCVAIRKFEEIVSVGYDPRALYYSPYGITVEKYEQDARAGVSIIALQASDGSMVHVPISYILSAPSQGGIPYKVVVLGVGLSAIPDAMDLTYLKNKISQTVFDEIGVAGEVKEVVISQTTHLDTTEHLALSAARSVNKTSSSTDYAKYLEAARQRDAALARITQLENYIITNMP